MKIVHIISSVGKSAGGTAEIVPKICSVQQKAGLKVTLTCRDIGSLSDSDVVLLWYEFGERVLGLDLRRKYLSWMIWCWRRAVFFALKHAQWLVCVHPYVKSRLRNTHGLPCREKLTALRRWA